MPLVFKTKKGEPPTEVVGAGVAGADGKGGIVIDDRVTGLMAELQEKGDDGLPKVDDDGQPVVLTGKALEKAAREFADARGLTVVSLSDEKAAKLPQEVGMPPDMLSPGEYSEREHAKTYEGLEPVNDDPAETSVGGADVGEPAPPAGDDKEGGR